MPGTGCRDQWGHRCKSTTSINPRPSERKIKNPTKPWTKVNKGAGKTQEVALVECYPKPRYPFLDILQPPNFEACTGSKFQKQLYFPFLSIKLTTTIEGKLYLGVKAGEVAFISIGHRDRPNRCWIPRGGGWRRVSIRNDHNFRLLQMTTYTAKKSRERCKNKLVVEMRFSVVD